MPEYFELSWAILSTIGVVNVLFGLSVIGIVGPSAVALIPIVVSAAGAIANGLCYYAYYADYPTTNTAVAAGVTDLMWMVQEAGISFYSYAILVRVLRYRDLTVFKALFWTLMIAIFVIRMFILVTRQKEILEGNLTLQDVINRLHVGYFTCIASVECVSAFFLLRKFSIAKKISREASLGVGLFQHLTRSTEIRLAALAIIGVTRAVTYFFQPSLQQATNTPSQFDRFIYTFECLFPVMIFIDLLASKLVFREQLQRNNPFSRLPVERASFAEYRNSAKPRESRVEMAGVWNGGAHGFGAAAGAETANGSVIELNHFVERPVEALIATRNTQGIQKTVEFGIYESKC